MRIIRDPIHGDVVLGPVHAAIVDTVIFQRLRYIRQNGLLHFVFPGAVHTRFVHSLGTMEVARRVFRRLMSPISADAHEPPPIKYLACAFELAALLHDVGHCAFSHSIEDVQINGQPLLGTVSELFGNWKEDTLLEEYLKGTSGEKSRPVSHEQSDSSWFRGSFLTHRW